MDCVNVGKRGTAGGFRGTGRSGPGESEDVFHGTNDTCAETGRKSRQNPYFDENGPVCGLAGDFRLYFISPAFYSGHGDGPDHRGQPDGLYPEAEGSLPGCPGLDDPRRCRRARLRRWYGGPGQTRRSDGRVRRFLCRRGLAHEQTARQRDFFQNPGVPGDFVGMPVIYIGGCFSMYLVAHLSVWATLVAAVFPFLFGDVVKVLIAAFLATHIHKC